MYFAFWTIVGIIFLALTFRKETQSPHSDISGMSDDEKLDIIANCRSEEPIGNHDENVRIMQKIIAEHRDYTAEVLPFDVYGRKKVEVFRLLNPGDEMYLKVRKDTLYIYAFDEIVSEIYLDDNSRIPQIISEKIPYETYLGGRSAFNYDDTYDEGRIIVFYKIDGILPSEIILK